MSSSPSPAMSATGASSAKLSAQGVRHAHHTTIPRNAFNSSPAVFEGDELHRDGADVSDSSYRDGLSSAAASTTAAATVAPRATPTAVVDEPELDILTQESEGGGEAVPNIATSPQPAAIATATSRRSVLLSPPRQLIAPEKSPKVAPPQPTPLSGHDVTVDAEEVSPTNSLTPFLHRFVPHQ